MKTTALAMAAATLGLTAVLGGPAEARGLRFGFGVGIGIGLGAPLAMHGAGSHHPSRPRGETIVNGRYRCCVETERYVAERPAKPAPRVQREEKAEKVEREEKKTIRKKPAKVEETEVAVARPRPAKAPTKPVQLAKRPAPTPPAPAGAESPAAAAELAPAALAVTQAAPPAAEASQPDARIAGSAPVKPEAGVARRGPRAQTAGQPKAEPVQLQGEGELNCRRYFPSLGETIAVSCME